MNTKILLSASAIVMGALGIAGSFMPQEALVWTGIAPSRIATLLVQLLAALLFGFAMVNWIARGSLIGGIYNRAVAVGNTAHFVIGALALAKGMLAGERHPLVLVLTLLYVVFAIAFSVLFFRSPMNDASAA